MRRHTLRLVGPRAQGARLSATIFRDALDALIAGARHAVRLRVDGRGLTGQPPAWLERVSEIDVLPLEAGSTVIALEAPTLAEAAPERFSQLDFVLGLDPTLTSVDVMEESLSDALSDNAGSERFDAGLLKTLAGFGRLWRHGIEHLELDGHRGTIRLDSRGTAKLETLEKAMPPDQRVVVVGKLDQLHHSRRMFTIRTDDGKDVRGVAGEHVALDELGNMFGRRAAVSGVARFRPSGDVLLVDADAIDLDQGTTSVFSRVPKPLFPAMDVKSLSRPQGPKSGISAIFGSWPGDETDEETLAILDEIS